MAKAIVEERHELHDLGRCIFDQTSSADLRCTLVQSTNHDDSWTLYQPGVTVGKAGALDD